MWEGSNNPKKVEYFNHKRPQTISKYYIKASVTVSDLEIFSPAVDECFEELLNDMFGAQLMSEFRAKRPAGYIDLMIAFESRKRSCGPNKLAPLNIALPFSFIDFYRRQKGKDVSALHDLRSFFKSFLL